MIQIDPKVLAMIARLAFSLKPTAAMDGQNSHAKHCHLSVGDDGKLRVCLTDSLFAFISEFPTSGDKTPWKETIQIRLVKAVFRRMASVVEISKKRGGVKAKVGFAITQEHTLQLTKGQFLTNLPLETMVNPFPKLDIPTVDSAWATLSRPGLYQVLDFLARSPGREDPEDKSQLCSLFKDGVAVANLLGCILLARSPELPFDLFSTRHYASRVLAWLDLLKQVLPDTEDGIQIAEFKWGGTPYYSLRDLSNTHVLCFPAASRPFPRKQFDDWRNTEVAIAVVADRVALTSTAFLLAKVAMAEKMNCTLKQTQGTKWTLHLQSPSENTGFDLQNTLPVTLHLDEYAGPPEIAFSVTPARLFLALQRLVGKQVLLSNRNDVALLGIKPYSPSATNPEGYVENEVFIRFNPDNDNDEKSDAGESDAQSAEQPAKTRGKTKKRGGKSVRSSSVEQEDEDDEVEPTVDTPTAESGSQTGTGLQAVGPETATETASVKMTQDESDSMAMELKDIMGEVRGESGEWSKVINEPEVVEPTSDQATETKDKPR